MSVPSVITLPAATAWKLTVGAAVAMAVSLIAVIISSDRMTMLDLPRSRTADEILAQVNHHPADRTAWGELSQRSLGFPAEGRKELWRLSRSTLNRLAPSWPTAQLGTLRAAFLNWSFLGPEDQGLALETAGRLIERPDHFSRYWSWIWKATGDLPLVLDHAPDEVAVHRRLSSVAATAGYFDEYRRIREGLPDLLAKELAANPRSPDGLIREVSSLERGPASIPEMRLYLAELAARSFQRTRVNQDVLRSFVDFAIRYDLEGLEAFEDVFHDRKTLNLPLLARYFLAIGDEELATLSEHDAPETTDRDWIAYHVERARNDLTAGNSSAARDQLESVLEADRFAPEYRFAALEVARTLGDSRLEDELEGSLLEELGIDVTEPDRWEGLCGGEICRSRAAGWFYLSEPGLVRIRLEVIESDSVPPWIEWYVDDQRVVERALRDSEEFLIQVADSGLHRIEVRIANPKTRAAGRRIVAIRV